MAYSSGTSVANANALMTALNTFAVGQGWTSNILDTTNKWLALNNGSVFVQFRWDDTNAIAIFQSTGFVNTSTAPGNHTNDDGHGQVDSTAPYNSTITQGRRVSGIGAGPFTAYHFFTDGTTKYIHVVLEYTPGIYRHFSFGTINKQGDWVGGQYAVGHVVNSSYSYDVTYSGHRMLWSGVADGSYSGDVDECGSVRVEGLPTQSAGMRWMALTKQTSNLGNDRGGNARIAGQGGICGSNPWLTAYGHFRASLLNGFVPLIQIPIWWRNKASSPYQMMYLGNVPDVYHIQMANMLPGQEFVVGADTFKVFPLLRKQYTGFSVEESRNCGIVYRKVP